MQKDNFTVARPYAEAAYALAEETGKVTAWSDMVRFLGAVVADPDMRSIIKDPRIAEDKLTQLVLGISPGVFDAEFENFVRVLISSERLAVAPEIATVFEERRAKAEGIADVELVTAFPLDADQQSTITAAVKARLNREVRVTTTIDTSLIGGVLIRVGDLVIDASLKGRLQELTTAVNRN